MATFLQKLRSKPKFVRTQYAFLGAFIVTLLLTTVWVLSIPTRISTTLKGELVEEENDSQLFSLFGEAKERIGAGVHAFTETIGSLGDKEKEGEVTLDNQPVSPSEDEATILRESLSIRTVTSTTSKATSTERATTSETVRSDSVVATSTETEVSEQDQKKAEIILIATTSSKTHASGTIGGARE